VALCAVGDWLDAEGATTNDITATTAVEHFTAAYIGPFHDELDYTRHRMDQLGWTRALHDAGIPERYLDVRAINHDWFNRHVRSTASGTCGRVKIFHRNPTDPATATH
jgi:antirestriction protein